MDAYIGTIFPSALNFAPKGWALCNGATLNISQNQALYAVIGTKYGGNGTTTFQLPNLQGRIPLNFNTAPNNGQPINQLGSTGGTLQAPVAAHSHTASFNTGNIAITGNLIVSQNNATASMPATNLIPAKPVVSDSNGNSFTANQYAQDTNTNIVNMNAVSASVPAFTPSVTISTTGSGNNMQPYLVVNYLICLVGLFPTRP